MYTDEQWAELDSLEGELESLEHELEKLEDERSKLDMDDPMFENYAHWYDEEIAAVRNEIQNVLEELKWLRK